MSFVDRNTLFPWLLLKTYIGRSWGGQFVNNYNDFKYISHLIEQNDF